MSKRLRRRAIGGVLIAIGLLILLLFAAQAWLATGIGRGVIENRLSAALGRPVRLDGEFEVGFFPGPGASGTELKLFTRDGRWQVAGAGSFLARLALRPLLRGEVEVTALRLENAAIDLGKLASEPGGDPATAGEGLRIPDIRSFELSDVSLYLEGMGSQPHVQIAGLVVDDFRLDSPAPFEAETAVVSEGEDLAGVAARGTLTLRASGVVEASLSRLDVVLEGWAARGFEGGFSADIERAVFGIGLGLKRAERPFSVGARIAGNADFAGGVSGFRVEAFELVSGSQRISGTGCLLDGTPAVLHAELASESIDLDALFALIETWRVQAHDAAGRGPGTWDGPSGEVQEFDLPFDVALRFEVEQATYGGAVAEGILLRAGSRPQCP